MATKNLARTVIEGGRSGNYKSYVHFEKRSERQRIRVFCNRFIEFVHDEEWCEELASIGLPEPLSPLSYNATDPKFKDKLGVLPYWLYAHVGKPWNEVNSLVRKRFDDRTISGQHILYDHLLPQVLKPTDRDYFEKDTGRGPWDYFVVDNDGILQLSQRGKELFNKSTFKRDYRKVKPPKSWRKNSLIIDHGKKQFWTEPLKPQLIFGHMCTWKCTITIAGKNFCRKMLSLRQTDELTPIEKFYWEGLGEYTKQELRYEKSDKKR